MAESEGTQSPKSGHRAGAVEASPVRRFWRPKFTNLWPAIENWKLWAGTVSAVVVITAVALVAAANQSSPDSRSHASASAGARASAPGHGNPRMSAPAKTSAPPTPEQAASSVHVSAQLGAALRAWNKGPGGSRLAAVTSDVGAALQAGGLGQLSSMKYECTSLAGAISSAERDPAIPDPATQERYASALGGLRKAAADCRSAISLKTDGDETVAATAPAVQLKQAQKELGSGVDDLYPVNREIAAALR